jgi:hypothetical protein
MKYVKMQVSYSSGRATLRECRLTTRIARSTAVTIAMLYVVVSSFTSIDLLYTEAAIRMNSRLSHREHAVVRPNALCVALL